jgi:hypothetical protein
MHDFDAPRADFHDLLAEQLRAAPWLALSLAAHVLVGCFFWLLARLEPAAPPPVAPPNFTAQSHAEDRVEQAPLEELPREEQVSEEPREEPVVASDDTEQAEESEQGEDSTGSSYEGGATPMEGAGLGDGRGGRRGRSSGGLRSREGSGGRTTQAGVTEGLQWLALHQDEDGHWDADEFDRHCEGAPCVGAGGSLHDVGLTGLALLAFLGDGHHPNRNTPYRHIVRRGVRWLVEQTAEGGGDDGLIGGRKGRAFLYDHALAALALCDAYYLSGQETLREPAQRAVNFVLRARNPYKAWRYEAPPNGENDSSITGWMVFVLKTAQQAGLDIEKEALAGALALFDELSDSATGRCGYLQRGEAPARTDANRERFPATNSESLTAVALLCRIFLGQRPDEHPILEAHADLLSAKPPLWSEHGTTHDFYYWYYATFALFQMGGERWARWNDKLKAALLTSQRRDGHAKGSWDPLDPWGEDGGRIYSTAMAVLCLEVYYRYAPVLANERGRPR